MSRRALVASVVLVTLLVSVPALAQSPSALYTFEGTGDLRAWARSFGTNSVTLDNATAGQLTITETGTAGSTVAVTDGANRVRESSTAASGGTDLTGLDYLEFDIGHNGSGPVNVQFFVQASTGFNFVALGPDLAVGPGVNTYQVPLTSLTADQQVYIRTMGVNIRDHAALGNLTWTLGEVRSGGTPLTVRDLITHDAGTAEGGLQGALVNFDNAAVQGNNAGQNQTGLSHNASGTGSLQWTDLGGSNGAAIAWGNGTAWNGNTFNNRTTDVSNYDFVTVTMSATDPNAGGGTLGVQAYFQKNGFAFQSVPDGQELAIDGQFHDLTFSLAGLTDMNVVEWTGINLGAHAQDLVINVDRIRFTVVPEPGAGLLLAVGCLGLVCRGRRRHE